MREKFPEGLAAHFADFVARSQRGFVPERRASSKPIKLVRVEEQETPAAPTPQEAIDVPAQSIAAIG